MTRPEVDNLPLGRVFDQIAVWQICECGAKEIYRLKGSLFEQMQSLKG